MNFCQGNEENIVKMILQKFPIILRIRNETIIVIKRTRVTSIPTVDGQKVPDVHRRLICQKDSVSRNFSQKVIPSDENFSCTVN